MKRLFILLAVVTFSVSAQAPAAKFFPACFSPETLAVLRIDAPQLLDQPLFLEALDAKAGADGRPFFQIIRDATGVDLDAVKEVWIAPQQGKDRMVAVLKGTFDAPTIRDRVGGIETMQVVQREGVPLAVLINNNNRPEKSNLAVVLDKQTLVFGRPELVDGFLTAFLGEGKGLPPALAPRATAMLESKALVSFLLLKLPADATRKNPWLRIFTHAEGEVTVDQENVMLEVVPGLAKPEMREPATKTIEGVRDMYGLLDKDLQRLGPVPSMLLENVTVKPDPKQLVVELSLPREVIEQLLRPKLGLR